MPDLEHALKQLRWIVSKAENLHQGLCACPSLLRRSIRDALRPLVKAEALLPNTLAAADDLADQILGDHRLFYLGSGPIELLALDVDAKRLSLPDALERARDESFVDAMVPLYVFLVAERLAADLAHQGQWRRALTLLRLLRAAVDASPDPPERERNLCPVESAFVEAAISSLKEVPDRRLLEEAVACGERVVARTPPGLRHGAALHRLGVLHLDPYVKNLDLRPGNYRADFERWHQGFGLEYGASASSVPYMQWRMPPIEEAIPKAVAYLRRAVDARKGRERGLSLKALAEALRARDYLQTGETHSAEACDAARQALALLDPELDADHVLTLQHMLAIAPPIGASDGFGGLQPRRQIFMVLMEAEQRLKTDPRGALTALQAARELFDVNGLPRERMTRLEDMARALRPAFAPGEDLSRWGRHWDQKLATLEEKVRRNELQGRALAACAVELALLSMPEDKEQRATHVLHIAWKSESGLVQEYEEVLRFVRYLLCKGAAVNAFKRKDYQNALTAYLAALGVSLPLRLGNLTLDMLMGANDVLDKAGTVKVTENVRDLLAANWIACEGQLQESGALLLTQLAQQLDRSLFSGSSEHVQTAWILWQLAKGLRYASSLSTDVPPPPPEESELLEEIRLLERLLNPAETPQPDDDAIMVSVLRSGVVTKGSDDFVRLANRQHEFDVVRERRLASAAPKPRFIALLDAPLDSDSALLNLFLSEAPRSGVRGRLCSALLNLGSRSLAERRFFRHALYLALLNLFFRSPERRVALRWFLVFPDGFATGTTILQDIPSKIQLREIDGLEVVMHPFAHVVLELRKNVRAEAGFDPIIAQGAAMLERCEAGLMGQIRSEFDKRPATKHLVVVPQGPLHFAPMHLLGPAQSMIGERVVITYLPNLALWGRPSGPRIEGMLSVGISFQAGNPRKLWELPDAPEEAREIAELFGGVPLPEQEATPARIRELLPRHRFVHLATHGAQNAFAPAFHHLNLTPGIDGEDRLFAHDLDGMDLSSLEMVTLSACESALGRVDATDNLRGIAASLFRCGAQTIVGTLWHTRTKVCRQFFTTLYRGIKTGASKRDAFAAAQRETRKKHPKYRDWGSFYLMGDWR